MNKYIKDKEFESESEEINQNIKNKDEIKIINKFIFNLSYYFYTFSFIIALSFSFFLYFLKHHKYSIILLLSFIICLISSIIYYYIKNELDLFDSFFINSKLSILKKIKNLINLNCFITNPLILISLSLFFSLNSNISFSFLKSFYLIILSWLSFLLKFIGDEKIINSNLAYILNFIPFLLIYLLLYITYIKPKNIKINNFVFYFYFMIWFFYNIISFYDSNIIYILYNLLDILSKSFISIGFSIYFFTL